MITIRKQIIHYRSSYVWHQQVLSRNSPPKHISHFCVWLTSVDNVRPSWALNWWSNGFARLTLFSWHLQIKDNRPVSVNAKLIPGKAAPIEESSGKYAMLREVTHDYSVGPGIYCIIPTTQFPGEEAEFLLRVLTPQEAELRLVVCKSLGTSAPYILCSTWPCPACSAWDRCPLTR